jgi:glucose/arabinose dehydrogenase
MFFDSAQTPQSESPERRSKERFSMGTQRLSRTRLVLALLTTLCATGIPVESATLPAGFSEGLVASGLASPTAMQLAPDGRLFICEQRGRLRIVKNGTLMSTPFVTVTVSAVGERGLLGVTFDPNFSSNHYVYVYYTATTPAVHNRISRFTANGDVAVAGSEVVIFELDDLSSATNHNGGALAFGPDGKLYAAVGENANGQNSQSIANVLGKMLRINRNGTIPTDNPFYTSASGRNRAIWALGLRNPFTFAFNRTGTELFINDVGQNTWEEIDDGIAGANYGWPTTEGPTTDPRFQGPRYAYTHSNGACAITGGAFYSPLSNRFPGDYFNDYFFADYCAGWIRKLDTAGNTVVTFATGLSFPVGLEVADDGSVYYLTRGTGASTGAVYRITYGSAPPTITMQPSSRTVAPGASVTFSVRASGTGPLRYQWQRNGGNVSGATAQDYTVPSVVLSDNGARFRAIVRNDFGSVTSREAVLTVSTNQAPTPTISQPAIGSLYAGGSVINYAGSASDPEDGTLPASAFTWRVDFQHDTHSHPFIPETTGARSGSFTVPTTGETSSNVWYRIFLTVRDAGGLTATTYRDVYPRKVRLTLATSPGGLQLLLDGQPIGAPFSFDAVVGIVRSIEAKTPQAWGGTTYGFTSWSDDGAARHTISTPATNTTYTATYRATSTGSGTGLSAAYFDTATFGGATVRRTDATVNFRWGLGAPMSAIGADTFSVRWTGQVEAQFSQTYTFYTQSDDGVRLWVNGQKLVDNWTNHSLVENRGTIVLTAGQRYAVVMEYFENTLSAAASLLWSSASTPKAVVPRTRLYPAAAISSSVRPTPGQDRGSDAQEAVHQRDHAR